MNARRAHRINLIGVGLEGDRDRGHTGRMTIIPAPFNCPLCDAEFKVVRIEAVPEGPEYPVFCPACESELPSRDNGAILKYFLVADPASREQRRQPASSAVRSALRPAPRDSEKP